MNTDQLIKSICSVLFLFMETGITNCFIMLIYLDRLNSKNLKILGYIWWTVSNRQRNGQMKRFIDRNKRASIRLLRLDQDRGTTPS